MTSFKEIMIAAEISGSSVLVHVDETWMQGRTVYGGMQAAIAVKAMRVVLDAVACDAPLRSLQVTFIGPISAGAIEAKATILRKGRSATQVQASIFEDGSLRLMAIGIFGDSRSSEISDIPLASQCGKSLEESEEESFVAGLMPDFLQNFIVRPAELVRLFSGAKNPRGVSFARLREQDEVSEESLVAIADIAPPVAMAALKKFAPASSMNWQLEFVQTPKELLDNQWLRVDAEMIAGVSGYNWQNTNFWSEDGKLAMISRQCLAVFG